MPELIRRLISFTTVGGLATVAHYVILVLLVELAGLSAVAASAAGYVAGAALNYWLNYHLTFRSQREHVDAAPRFLLIALIGLAINSCIVAIGTRLIGFNYLAVQLAATAIVLFWNFAANSAWTFSRRSD
jgi:putative flippase GtrA